MPEVVRNGPLTNRPTASSAAKPTEVSFNSDGDFRWRQRPAPSPARIGIPRKARKPNIRVPVIASRPGLARIYGTGPGRPGPSGLQALSRGKPFLWAHGPHSGDASTESRAGAPAD